MFEIRVLTWMFNTHVRWINEIIYSNGSWLRAIASAIHAPNKISRRGFKYLVQIAQVSAPSASGQRVGGTSSMAGDSGAMAR